MECNTYCSWLWTIRMSRGAVMLTHRWKGRDAVLPPYLVSPSKPALFPLPRDLMVAGERVGTIMTIEAQSFLERLSSGISLDAVLKPSLDDEAELRHLFATDKTNERLNNPYVGLLNIFDAPENNVQKNIAVTRAREVKDGEDLTAKYIMPLTEDNRRRSGDACMVPEMETFKKNWSIFTEGSLSQLLDWNNVVAAGGSVLACLTPLPESATVSKRATRKFYHSNFRCGSVSLGYDTRGGRSKDHQDL